jgi:hypothetical protein
LIKHRNDGSRLTSVYQSQTVGLVPKESTTQVAFRLADRLLARVDRHAKRMSREQRGVVFTRVDAVRDLLTRALEIVENEASSTKEGRS